jgi:two-component system chemotaxis response regulator CheB
MPSDSSSAPVRRRRVLIVDDSPFIRRVLRDVIQASPDFEVAGEASDGWEAIRQVQLVAPELVTLDVHMPGLDGLATLGHLMRESPRPVVMLSALSDGGDTTMRALELGAVDFVRKPAMGDALDLSTLEERLLGALRSAADARCLSVPILAPARRAPATARGATRPDGTSATRASPDPSVVAAGGDPWGAASRASASWDVGSGRGADDDVAPTHLIVLAASTGGPRALAEVVPALAGALAAGGDDRRAAIVIAQHMPPGFTDSLARRLDALSPFAVREGHDGEWVRAGTAYVAPGGVHTTVEREGDGLRLAVRAGAPVHGVAPAADLLFASASAAIGAACVAVVLTGMGHDGAQGARAVRAAGGRLVVQDAATSVVHGMPQAAQQAAGADAVAPLHAVADVVLELLGRRSDAPAPVPPRRG